MAEQAAENLIVKSFGKSGSGRFYADVTLEDGTKYVYVPREFVEKGARIGKTQYFDQSFLNKDYLSALKPINLSEDLLYDEIKKVGYENPTSGFLISADDFKKFDKNGNGVTTYKAEGKFAGEVLGIGEKDGNLVYSFKGSGGSTYGVIDKSGTPTETTVNPGKSRFGWLGQKLGDVAETFAGIPFAPEIIGAATGNPALYASLKSLQTAGAGGDLGDVLESGAKAYVGTQIAPTLSSALPTEIASLPGAVPAISGTAQGLLSGKDIGEALQQGVATGAGSVVGTAASGATSPTVGTTAGNAIGQIAGGTTAGMLGGAGATEALLASTIGAAGTLAGQTAKGLFTETPQQSTAGSTTMSDDEFFADLYAYDAKQLADQGFDSKTIEQVLSYSGASPDIAFDAAQLASQGLSANSIYDSIIQNITGTTPGTAVSGTSAAGNVASTLASKGVTGLLKSLLGTGGTAAAGTGLLGNLSSLLGGGTGSITDIVKALTSAGIDAATAEKLATQAREEGATAFEAAKQAGAEAQVPFTPYTVTSGFGKTTVGPEGATTALAPEYAGIRKTALEQAASTLGAIRPEQASQTLFGQLEGLAAPARQREQAALLSGLGAKGLLGIGRNLPTVGGGTAAVNPYMESLLSAQQTAQAQNALASTQFGTQEAIRQQALAQSLLGMGTGLDTLTGQQLTQTSNLGQVPLTLAQNNAQKQLEATLAGLRVQLPYQQQAGLIEAQQTASLGDLYKAGAEGLFKEIFG